MKGSEWFCALILYDLSLVFGILLVYKNQGYLWNSKLFWINKTTKCLRVRWNLAIIEYWSYESEKPLAEKGVSPLLQKIPWNILTSHLICFSRKVVLQTRIFFWSTIFSNQKKNPSLKKFFFMNLISRTRFLKPDF